MCFHDCLAGVYRGTTSLDPDGGESPRPSATSKLSPILGRCLRRQSSSSRRSSTDSTLCPSTRPASGASYIGKFTFHTFGAITKPALAGSHLGSPSSSPARLRRAAAKKMSNLWFSLKNSSPLKKARGSLWSVPRDRFRKRQFEDAGRLSYSHPDISHSNLARIGLEGSHSKDDMSLVFTSIPSPQITTTTTAGNNKCSDTKVIKSQIHLNEARRKLLEGTTADSFVSS